jgi:hypothetical protein
MRKELIVSGALLAVTAGSAPDARADAKSAAARELAHWAMGRFGRKVVGEGVESFTKRIVSASSRYGDDLVSTAVRRVGPKALTYADDAAKHAPHVLRFLGRYGDEGAAVLSKTSTKLLALGDDAAKSLVTHKGIAEPLLERFGSTGARALAAVTPKSGRRIAMLKATLLNSSRAVDVMQVIAKHGDRAVNFIWEHKGALAIGTTLAAFLANPEPFIDGTKQLTEVVVEKAVVPVTQSVVAGSVKMVDAVATNTLRPLAQAAAKAVPWGPLSMVLSVFAAGVAALMVVLRRPFPASAVK